MTLRGMDDHLEGHPSATDTGQGLEDPGKGKCRGRDGGVANRLWPSTREPSTLGGSVRCLECVKNRHNSQAETNVHS